MLYVHKGSNKDIVHFKLQSLTKNIQVLSGYA